MALVRMVRVILGQPYSLRIPKSLAGKTVNYWSNKNLNGLSVLGSFFSVQADSGPQSD